MLYTVWEEVLSSAPDCTDIQRPAACAWWGEHSQCVMRMQVGARSLRELDDPITPHFSSITQFPKYIDLSLCFSFNRKKAIGGRQSKLCQNPTASGPESNRRRGVAIHEAAVSHGATQLTSAEPHACAVFCGYSLFSYASYDMIILYPFWLVHSLSFIPTLSTEIWT